MAEKVKTCGVSKEKGYLYYLGKDGNVWRSGMSRGGSGGGNAEKVADAGVTREVVTYTSSIKTVMYLAHLWLEVEVNKLLSF